MRRIILAGLVYLISYGTDARAAGRAEGDIQLTLEEAVARAEERSPTVRRARGERRVVEALRVGAALALPSNPVVAGSVGARSDSSRSVPSAEGGEWGLHVEQAFEIGGQRGARIHEARRAVDVASARERLARTEARARARAAYLGVLLSREQVAAAEHRAALGAQVLLSATATVGAGAASDVELHLAGVEPGRRTH